MFKSKRRSELERTERELYFLKMEIRQIADWCAADSPEIGFAMQRLMYNTEGISAWRDKLRAGEFSSLDKYKEYLFWGDKLRKGEFTWQKCVRPSQPKTPESRITEW